MYLLPTFKQLHRPTELDTFSQTYARYSGLPIPKDYLETQRVYAFFSKGQMIGGFILGKGPDYRTIKLFAQEASQPSLHKVISQKGAATELCCFWIARHARTRTWINVYIWMCMAYTLRFSSQSQILFGTNSHSLAKLYASTPHSVLINSEPVGTKHCYIFQARSNVALRGISEIVSKKLRRVFRLKKERFPKSNFLQFLSTH